jgi:hypothetical protein
MLGERMVAFKMLLGKDCGKRSLWKPRHRWENNIKILM